MADLKLTTDATVPANTSISAIVYEDATGDGTADTYDSVFISDGVETQYVSGFDASAGNEVWVELGPFNTDKVSVATLNSVEVSIATENVLFPTVATTTSTGLNAVIPKGGLTTTVGVTTSAGQNATLTVAGSGFIDATLTTTTSSGLTATLYQDKILLFGTAESSSSGFDGTIITSGTATVTTTVGATDSTVFNAVLVDELPARWQLTRSETEIEDSLIDIQTTNSANPFGDYAVAQIDDIEGQSYAEYPYSTQVEAEIYIEDVGTISDFTGFVVERRETDKNGADSLEVEAYTFDQFLRKADVTNDQTGNTISEALQDIITTDTPVSYNSFNVDVVDDTRLSQSLKDERVESALQILAFKSGNEGFGVNDNLQFYFRPREREHIDRGISNADWFNYDLPERGKEAINEVEVRYNEGNESVVVDNPGQKLDLQNNLNLPDPGTQRARINRPEITDPKDAEDEGRRFLKFRNATLSGTVTTYGLYQAKPFDTIDVEIIDRGIDSEFIITKVEKFWGRDETTLTLVENRGFDDDFIVRLSEKTERLDLRDSDPDAQEDRITTTNIAANMDVYADVGGTAESASRFVNTGLNLVRDGWADDGNLNITTLAVGTDGSGLSRSNTSLQNQVATASATETLVGDSEVEYSASVSQTGIEEVGLIDGSGNLICRATLDSAVDLSTQTVTVSIDISNDSTVERGVLTTLGQETTRDVVADNTPNLPVTFAYGSGSASPTVSDTALATSEYTTSLTSILLRRLATPTEWVDNTSITTSDVIQEDGGTLALSQINYFSEGENYTTANPGNDSGSSDTDISNANYVSLSRGPDTSGGPDFATYEFTVDHTIPGEEIEFHVRHSNPTGGLPEFTWSLTHSNGQSYYIDDNSVLGADLGQDMGWDKLGFFSGDDAEVPPDLEKGTTHTLRVDVTNSNGNIGGYELWLDCVAPIDGRHTANLTFDETTNASDALSGPELYPTTQTITLDTFTTRRTMDAASFDLDINDTTNGFYVELKNSQSTYQRVSNSATGSVSFGTAGTDLIATLQLDRFSTTTTSTPTAGNAGQAINTASFNANIDAVVPDGIGEANTRAIIGRGALTDGVTLQESGQLDANGNTLTRSVFADVDITSQIQNLISSETTTFRTS